jgi:hypothetical protein
MKNPEVLGSDPGVNDYGEWARRDSNARPLAPERRPEE